MTEQERDALIVRCYEVHNAADRATSKDFLSTLEGVARRAKTYAFKHRLKSSGAIESKVRRKRDEGAKKLIKLESVADERQDETWREEHRLATESASYMPENVTDVLGCRFVTLYQSEIPIIVEALLKVIETHNGNPAFAPIEAFEFVIYTNRSREDPLSITNETLRTVERSPLFKDVRSYIRPPEWRKSAYSSVHFVFFHEVEIAHPGKIEHAEQTFFEIQIRDIFEEGWGEVQHDLLYSEKDKAAEVVGGVDHGEWSLHLNALKTFVDGCSQHASIIKKNLDGIRAARAPTTSNQSVSERKVDQQNIVQELHRIRATKAVEQKVSLGYSLLRSAGDVPDDEESGGRLLDAAIHLDQALSELSPRHRDVKVRNSGDLTIAYFLEMESAAARVAAAELPVMESRALQLRGEAEAIYERLIKRFSNDPTAQMRLGKLIEKRAVSLEDFKRSEALYDRAIDLIPGDPTTGSEHWIAISCRIDKGVSVWKQLRFRHDALTPAERSALLGEAARETVKACDIWHQQSASNNELNKVIGHKALTNVIFYLSAIHENSDTLGDEQRSLLERTITTAEATVIEPYPEWYKTRDNLLHGYEALGKETRPLAQENFSELRAIAERLAGFPLDVQDIRNHLRGSQLICFETALRLLAPTGSEAAALAV